MSEKKNYCSTTSRTRDFEFDEEVAAVFDDMLSRSIPFYYEQQSLIEEIARQFYIPGTAVIDLGSSTGTTLIRLARALDSAVRFIGYDNSQSMIDRALGNVSEAGLSDRIEIYYGDLNEELEQMEITNASIVTLCWTLQFVRPLKRDALIKRIYDGLSSGGVLIVTDKILTNDTNVNRFFIDFYYDFKRRNGYSNEEISQKREALENVLIPFRIDENLELFRRNGFQIVETFFQWYNFIGFLCVKNN